MALHRLLLTASLCVVGLSAATPVWSREAATPSACQAAATTQPIVVAKAAIDREPNDLKAFFRLAHAWSDAGCFDAAVQVLQGAQKAHAGNQELETRLRVARTLVGEDNVFDNIDRGDAGARLKRASLRCTSLYDLEACSEALHLRPDDPALLVAQGDSLVLAKRPAEALSRYRLAGVIAPNQTDVATKIALAESLLPEQTSSHIATDRAGERATRAAVAAGHPGSATAPASEQSPLWAASAIATATARRYSNAAPESHSH